MNHHVHFGAGSTGPENWTNFDISPSLRLQRIPIIGSIFMRMGPKFPRTVRYGDIIRGLPVADNSCQAIYCSHVLEHLSLEDFRTAIANTYRYLIPGGRFRFVLPDLERLASDYLNSQDPNASMLFMEKSLLGQQSRPRGMTGLLRSWLGNSAHLWMWDFKSISVELAEVGFVNIRRAQFGDSGDPMFESVERPAMGLLPRCGLQQARRVIRCDEHDRLIRLAVRGHRPKKTMDQLPRLPNFEPPSP